MSRKYGGGLIDPSFCCCAVPMVNAGIYAILGEQAIVGVVVGVMALATPAVVGASFPGFAKVIFAITCFAVTACQPIGFIGVLREKTSTFKVYLLLNLIATLAAFSTAAALIVTSALRHTPAMAACKLKYFTAPTANTGITSAAANETLSVQSNILCNAFTWASVGIMGGLWVILFLVQFYFIFVTRRYSTSQVKDHKLYHSVYSENPEAFTMSVLRSSRYNPGSVYSTRPTGPGMKSDDEWDSRPSVDSLRDDKDKYGYSGNPGQSGHEVGYGHHRGESSGAMLSSDNRDSYGGPQGAGINRASGRYDDAFDDGSGGYQNQNQYDQHHYSNPNSNQYSSGNYGLEERGGYAGNQNSNSNLNYDQAPPYDTMPMPQANPSGGGGYGFSHPGTGYQSSPPPQNYQGYR